MLLIVNIITFSNCSWASSITVSECVGVSSEVAKVVTIVTASLISNYCRICIHFRHLMQLVPVNTVNTTPSICYKCLQRVGKLWTQITRLPMQQVCHNPLSVDCYYTPMTYHNIIIVASFSYVFWWPSIGVLSIDVDFDELVKIISCTFALSNESI